MKYLKRYLENKKYVLEFEYSVGQYVWLGGIGWNIGPELKIIKQHNEEIKDNGKVIYDISYQVAGYDIRDDKYKKFWVDEYEIDRVLTKEEVEKYKINREAKKYNL